MAAISINFGTGGANLVPGRSGGVPTLAEALRDVADDLAGIKVAALAADASTDVVAANAIDLPTTLTLVNETKADFNLLRATVTDLRAKIAAAGSGYTLLTTKV